MNALRLELCSLQHTSIVSATTVIQYCHNFAFSCLYFSKNIGSLFKCLQSKFSQTQAGIEVICIDFYIATVFQSPNIQLWIRQGNGLKS